MTRRCPACWQPVWGGQNSPVWAEHDAESWRNFLNAARRAGEIPLVAGITVAEGTPDETTVWLRDEEAREVA